MPDCQTYYGNYVENLRGKQLCSISSRDSQVGYFLSSLSPSEIEIQLEKFKPGTKNDTGPFIFIRNTNGKTYGFYYIDKDYAISEYSIKEKFGDNVKSTFAAELNLLIQDFTMLEPKNFQKAAYSNPNINDEGIRCGYSELGSVNEDHPPMSEDDPEFSSDYDFLGLNKQGMVSASEALNQKEKIWTRYISRFSSIKESVSEKSSRITNVQINLDLNAFCKYGRLTSDLISK